MGRHRIIKTAIKTHIYEVDECRLNYEDATFITVMSFATKTQFLRVKSLFKNWKEDSYGLPLI